MSAPAGPARPGAAPRARLPVWAVVPAKSLSRGKSRLAGALSGAEREALNREFLARTVRVARSVRGIDVVLVVSPDPAALGLAAAGGAVPLREPGPDGFGEDLNRALTYAAGWAAERGAGRLLTVAADLPALRREDLEAVLAGPGPGPGVTIAPDEDETGTNVLLQVPPGIIPYGYGPGSFTRHLGAARARGSEPLVVRRPGLMFDVDSPEDLRRWRAAGPAAASSSLMHCRAQGA